MNSALDRLRKRLQQRISPQEKAEEKLTCPECANTFSRFEILNQGGTCPACGAAIDVDKKPRVFS